MATAVQNYAKYRVDSRNSWMLGRFILPASRLAEFEQHFKGDRGCWYISTLIGADADIELARCKEFNSRYRYGAQIDCVEVKAASVDEIEKLHNLVGATMTTYYEVSLGSELPSLLEAIKHANGRAKIRTGGVTPDAFPASDTVANFLIECARRELPFKATAGLHHPVRCIKPLTYEASAPSGTMHGFLNLFLCAVACRVRPFESERLPRASLLEAEHPELAFDDDFACFSTFAGLESDRGASVRIPIGDIRAARRNFAISFGSCSFEEPIADLKALNLL